MKKWLIVIWKVDFVASIYVSLYETKLGLLLSQGEVSLIFSIPYFFFAVTKFCKAYCHQVTSSAETMLMINTSIWNINTCITKQTLNCFEDFDSFSNFFMFLILRQRRRPYCSFSLRCISRSCRSFIIFSWRFEFYCFKFVTCSLSIATVELISFN